MPVALESVPQPTLILDNGKVTFEVPWTRGEHFQEVLKRRGIASILHLHPGERRAYLEPRTNLHPQQILEILKTK